METVIQEVKNKIDIVELIGSYIPVKKAGRNFKANCPFHNEKSPSFVISPDRQIWHCFGACGDGGDCIKFVMKWENISFYEALKELALKAGVQIKKIQFEDKEWQKREKIFQINNLAAEFFQFVLLKSQFGAPAMEYLKQRGVPEGIIKVFQLGYSPNSWDSLLKFLTKKGFSTEEILKAGLVVKSEKGKIYDRFRGRLMFPIKDIRGNIAAFSGRVLAKDAHEAKYINSPETEVYHKRESLFGIHLAKEAIRKENNVIVVEGEFDMISPYQYSIENVVAIKGTALTKEQLTLLKRLTSKITFALDGDAAGGEAMRRAIREAEEMDFELYVLDWDEAKDPDEMVRHHLAEFKEKLKSPISVYDFIIQLAQKKYPSGSAFDKKKIGEEVGPFISSIQNPIIQSHYLKKIAKLLEVSEDSILLLLRQYQQKNAKPAQFLTKPINPPKLSREESMEKYVLSYMFQTDKSYEIISLLSEVLVPEDFSIPAYKKIYQALLEYKSTHELLNLKEYCDSLPAELQAVCNELFLNNIEELQNSDSKKAKENTHIKKTIFDLKLLSLRKLQTVSSRSGNEELYKDLKKQYEEVEKKRDSLYNV